MTHIISKERGFAFVHIPRCGGSTIWRGLGSFDDTGRVFSPEPVVHEQLGRVWLGHLPLWAIEQHYRPLYDIMRRSWTFAITRDPFARFGSALAQRGRLFLGMDIAMLTEAQLHAEASKVARVLDETEGVVPPEFCHFIRQTDFVRNGDGDQVVATYPIEQYRRLLAVIEAKTGAKVKDSRVNATEVPLGRSARTAWSVMKRLFPERLQVSLRVALGGLVRSTGAGAGLSFVYHAPTRDFIEHFYREDFQLVEQTKKDFARESHLTSRWRGE